MYLGLIQNNPETENNKKEPGFGIQIQRYSSDTITKLAECTLCFSSKSECLLHESPVP